MLSNYYQIYSFASVSSLTSLLKENQPEMPKLRSLIENIKMLFKLPNNCIQVTVAEGERIYRVGLIMPGVGKIPIGYFVYIPKERRLDAYTAENPTTPLLQWKQKKLMYCGCQTLLEKAGISSLFNNLVNIL